MSTEDETVKQALVSLGVGPAAQQLYVDMLRPAALELGTNLVAIAKLVTIALSPLRGMVWGFDRIQTWLSTALLKRLAKTDPTQIQSPPAYISGQVLLQLPFCADQDHLREMYANLLASAMKKESVTNVHPAFVQIIQQLTPDEALIVQAIGNDPKLLALQESFDNRGIAIDRSVNISSSFRRYCELAGPTSPELSDTYLENLLRLRILSEFHWNEGELRHSADGWDTPYLANTSGRLIEVTALGERFLRTCTARERSDPLEKTS